MKTILELVDSKWGFGYNEFTEYANNPDTFNRRVVTQGDFAVFLNSLSFDELREFCDHFKFSDSYKLAADFMLDKFEIEMKTTFLTYDFHFDGDIDKRNIYAITFERKRVRTLIIPKFGQSVVNSCQVTARGKYFRDYDDARKRGYMDAVKNPSYGPPTAYDILSCLTKYDPGEFTDFCSEFGYDEDSRRAYKTYEAVRDEWVDVSRFFTDKELSQIQEIA